LDIRDYDQNVQKFEIAYEKNNLDRWQFPNYGSNLIIWGGILHNIHQEITYNSEPAKDVIGVPPIENFLGFQITNRTYSRLSENIVTEAIASYGYYDQFSIVDYFRIGGSETYTNSALPFIGSEQGEFRLQHYLYLRSAIRYEVSKNIYATLVANLLRGKSYNNTFLDKTILPEWKTIVGFGISMGLETLIGPVNIDFGYKNEADNLNFSIGVGYRHVY
jgi:hypothetical protein